MYFRHPKYFGQQLVPTLPSSSSFQIRNTHTALTPPHLLHSPPSSYLPLRRRSHHRAAAPLFTSVLTFSLFTALPHSPPPSSSRGNSFPVTITGFLCRAGDVACCYFSPSLPASRLSPIQVFLCHLCAYSSRTHGAATRPLRLASASASKSHSRLLDA
ncbi:hypothetical protein PIB30_081860 [Stylosanthes scabra]|uniref:Uncharacterized protein n=1 Tax=Stylosanthes scabra TaxID=79078 RepID=A0ABU6TRC0_9FABA|nr:hypothetical protein [Stylosanthes scabra]